MQIDKLMQNPTISSRSDLDDSFVSRVGVGEVVFVGLLLCVGCVLLCLYLGRDLNWDYLNYHDYAALLSVDDRVGQDFFPAGYQGYLNPIPFLPFQFMLSSGWHSASIGAAIAAIQSLNLFFLYLICRQIASDLSFSKSLSAFAVTILGGASCLFAAQLGSTFVDPTITPLVIAAVWLLLRSDKKYADVISGVLCGFAAGMKLTNVIYAIAICVSVLIPRQPRSSLRWCSTLRTCFGVIGGFLLAYGAWGWQLYKLFGSPVFPLFNGVFQAPDFPAESLSLHRFVPRSLVDLLIRPFQMASFESWIYSETAAPDIRPAVLVILGACLGLVAVLSAVGVKFSSPHSSAPNRGFEMRLWAFFVVSLLGWFLTSANGRYAIPILLLLGPCIYIASCRLVLPHIALGFCVVLSLLQIFHAAQPGNPRWNPMKWTEQWLPASVPKEFQREPALFLSIGASSESYLVRHLHRESVFVNPIGLFSIQNDGPGWSRFQSLLDKFRGRTKFVFRGNEANSAVSLKDAVRRKYANAVVRLGLKIVSSSCRVLRFNYDIGDKLIFNANLPDSKSRVLVVCDAEAAKEPLEAALERKQAEKILNALEKKCPTIFAPARNQTERGASVWSRYYPKFDLFVGVSFKMKSIFYYMEHQASDSVIGSTDSWEKDLDVFVCMLPQRGRQGLETLNSNETF